MRVEKTSACAKEPKLSEPLSELSIFQPGEWRRRQPVDPRSVVANSSPGGIVIGHHHMGNMEHCQGSNVADQIQCLHEAAS